MSVSYPRLNENSEVSGSNLYSVSYTRAE